MNVPCNGCRICCIRDAIRILSHEDASQWQTVPHPHPRFRGARMLAHKANGECIYLEAQGCGIYGHAPQQCREMDCRNIACAFTFTEMRRTPISLPVWRRGKELLGKSA